MSPRHLSLRTIFAAPAAIALLSLAGLLAGLLGGGVYDAACWAGLAVSLGAIVWALLRRRA